MHWRICVSFLGSLGALRHAVEWSERCLSMTLPWVVASRSFLYGYSQQGGVYIACGDN
jgi:hypothetical protein